MSGIREINLGFPALLEFRGPDAVRFLNGQLTQDVRRLAGGEISLPACVTDAKGKLQFRVSLTEVDGALWVAGPTGCAEDLEARLTRYLIADDVEVINRTGKFGLVHLTGERDIPMEGHFFRKSNRFGVAGTDIWFPVSSSASFDALALEGDELVAFRIANGIPVWGRELVEGMLPPEALLEETDISYNKGCYIGQEVISRVKSAGKVNRRLTRFVFNADAAVVAGPLENGAGEITSVSPLAVGKIRQGLGYLKRGATPPFYQNVAGENVQVTAS